MRNQFIQSTRKVLSRISKGYVLQSSLSNTESEKMNQKEIENLGFSKPDVTKARIEKALKDESWSKVNVDIESQAFRDEINKRAFVKNIKQKLAFVVGSLPIFNRLKEISIAAARNPQVQIPLSIPLYFGVSMPAFVALDIVEYTLPLGRTRNLVKGLKVISGIPFCTLAEIIDVTSTKVLKTLDLPDGICKVQLVCRMI